MEIYVLVLEHSYYCAPDVAQYNSAPELVHIFTYLMLWSQIIYGHRTVSISPKIVQFYGARTAPGRQQEETYDF